MYCDDETVEWAEKAQGAVERGARWREGGDGPAECESGDNEEKANIPHVVGPGQVRQPGAGAREGQVGQSGLVYFASKRGQDK